MIKISHKCTRCGLKVEKEFDDSNIDDLQHAHDFVDTGSCRGLCEECEDGYRKLRESLKKHRDDELLRYMRATNG